MVKLLTGIFTLLLLNGCASHSQTLYSELGGKQKVEEIVNNFVTEIEYDLVILPYLATLFFIHIYINHAHIYIYI